MKITIEIEQLARKAKLLVLPVRPWDLAWNCVRLKKTQCQYQHPLRLPYRTGTGCLSFWNRSLVPSPPCRTGSMFNGHRGRPLNSHSYTGNRPAKRPHYLMNYTWRHMYGAVVVLTNSGIIIMRSKDGVHGTEQHTHAHTHNINQVEKKSAPSKIQTSA